MNFQARRAALLSNTEVTGDGPGSENTFPTGSFNEVELLVTYNFIATSTGSIEIKVYWSDDGTNFFQDSIFTPDNATANVATRTFKFVATASLTPAFGVPVRGAFGRVSARNDTNPGSSTLAIQVVPRLR